VTPRARQLAGKVGAVSAGVSLLLAIVMLIWALARGGFPYYYPSLLRAYAAGILFAFVAVISSIFGKGWLRATGLTGGLLMFLFWIAMTATE
jgi:hypothetical protein